MEKVRINKYLASLGIGSRRKIDEMIEDRLVIVNGNVAKHGDAVSEEDKIVVDGRVIEGREEEKVYYMLHKPQKVVSAVTDQREKTVIDIIKDKRRIFPIGRLDLDTEGLLIVTNDGELYNRVVHPRAEIFKTYFAKVRGSITDSEIEQLKNGVELEDGMTLPAKVKLFKRDEKYSEIEISIREGRKRQIRRMLDKVNHRVFYLKRNSIGELKLDRDLKPGEYRELTKTELNYLQQL